MIRWEKSYNKRSLKAMKFDKHEQNKRIEISFPILCQRTDFSYNLKKL